MNPIPTWQSTLGNSPHIVAAGAVGQAMQAEIDALRQRNAELEADLEKHRELLLHHLSVVDPLRDRVKELEDACDKFSEAEILLKDFDVRGHPA